MNKDRGKKLHEFSSNIQLNFEQYIDYRKRKKTLFANGRLANQAHCFINKIREDMQSMKQLGKPSLSRLSTRLRTP